MAGGVHIAQFQFHMTFTLLSTKRNIICNCSVDSAINELVHNLKPTQFAITWQAKFQNLLYAMHFKF